MKKDNVKIKDTISIVDQITAIESLVSSAFTYNEETGNEEYTPYYIDMAKIIVIAENFLEGITFDKKEYIYDSVINDEEVFGLIKKFFYDITDNDDATKIINTENENYINTMSSVMSYANDKIEFMKQQLIHKNDGLEKIGNFCDGLTKAMSNFTKLNLNGISKDDIGTVINVAKKLGESDINEDTLVNAIKETGLFTLDKKTEEILDAKNTKIRELEKYKALWESRNVTAK